MSPDNNSVNWKEILRTKNIVLNLLGVSFITLALRGFMLPNKFLDGGVIGLSMLLNEVTHIPFAALVLVFNMLFLFLGKRILGKTFAVHSFITFSLISLFTYLVKIEVVTSDPILIALFGGCLIGIGMGLCVRSGSIADGVEILALLITRKIGLNISEVIFGINTFIFLIAAWVFGITTALYSIVTYFSAIKSLEYIADGLEQYTALNIISSKSDEIKSIIVNKFGKGITVIKGERGYLPESFNVKKDCDIVVTVVTRLELLRIKNEITELDPKAFMFIQYIKEASGGILRYRKKH